MKHTLCLLILALFTGCTTVHPDGTKTTVDGKQVVATVKSLREVVDDVSYLWTLYHQGQVIKAQIYQP